VRPQAAEEGGPVHPAQTGESPALPLEPGSGPQGHQARKHPDPRQG
jgi:hypothetical protein